MEDDELRITSLPTCYHGNAHLQIALDLKPHCYWYKFVLLSEGAPGAEVASHLSSPTEHKNDRGGCERKGKQVAGLGPNFSS